MTQSEKENNILDEEMKWYIVQTYVGFEDAVVRQLEQKIQNVGLQDKIVEIFVPTKKVLKLSRKGEREEKVEKVYPGYIYLRMTLNRETGYIVQNTQYVSRITGTGDFAVALEEGYVEKLKAQLLEESQQIKSKSSTIFVLGDLVKVVDGAFKDMTGKVSGIDEQNSRISVLLTIFDRETNVELDVLQVQKIA
jgi:transcription termination/antitermination protein NusG